MHRRSAPLRLVELGGWVDLDFLVVTDGEGEVDLSMSVYLTDLGVGTEDGRSAPVVEARTCRSRRRSRYW